ncbi:MAG: low molecular weight phosphotyrosine protein phosphatase [Deltaproteobacteria bacterium]|nr:low molecular weight phosphotyrosine protein phosphatase [Deltaproteobacteria bacterium]
MNILFVCTGNISRSFLAERLLREELSRLGVGDVRVSSAGLFASTGHSADPQMADYLAENKIPQDPHEARQITREDAEWADLILVMEKDHERILERMWPDAGAKVELLGTYLIHGGMVDDIVDPYGLSPYHYRLAQSQITLAVKNLAQKLVTARGRNHG